MSMVPLGGILSSAAGGPLSQTKGSETERAQKDSLAQQRQVDSDQKAEAAAGIGQTSEDQESADRDADGRRPWEFPGGAKENTTDQSNQPADPAGRQSKDSSGQSGTQLDLTG